MSDETLRLIRVHFSLQDGFTPLAVALQENHEDVVKILMDVPSTKNVKSTKFEGLDL
jgi:hypothetical protein